MTAVPRPTLGPTGFIIPSTSDILNGVCTDIQTAFGGRLNLDPTTNPSSLSTPQGQLASSIAAVIDDKNQVFLSYSSQVDPQYAQGRMQDAIGQIYFMTRFPATPTTVSCLCTGLAGTVIPANAQAQDTSGNIYVCVTGGTIPVGGSITLAFANVATGPIACPVGTLNKIYVSVPGWDTISNTTGTDTDSSLLGRNVETQQQFEYRRKNSVALNSVGAVPSVYATVFESGQSLVPPSTPTDVYVVDNPLDTSAVVGGVTLAPHSLYVAVVGGDDNEIAKAIWSKKATGCNYNGNTTVNVQDPSGYSAPVPTYAVTFERPAAESIYFVVNIVNNPSLPADIVTQIQNAVASAFVGGDGGAPARIGSTIYASRFYAPILAVNALVEILSVFVGSAPAPTGNSVSINIDKYPTINPSNVAVNLV